MKNTTLLSEDAKTYLCCFYKILDEMVHSMTTAGLGQSISRNFIVQMIPHHQAAIQFSNNILRFTENPGLRCAAQRMIRERTQTIGQMEAVLDTCGQLANPQTDLRLCQRRMDLIYRDMYIKMGSSPENNRLAAVFLRQMLPHCLGAAHMADTALKYDVSTQLVPILRSIAACQRRDAAQIRTLLGRLDCQR